MRTILILILLVFGVGFCSQSADQMRDGARSTTSVARDTYTPPPPAKETWKTSISTSEMDDSETVGLTLQSNNFVRASLGGYAPAVLTVRCFENTTAVLFSFADLFMADVSGYGRITYRIDKDPARTQNFTESTDNSVLGLWSGGASIPFIKRMFGGEEMIVRATPYNETPVEAVFRIVNLETAIEPLRKACHW